MVSATQEWINIRSKDRTSGEKQMPRLRYIAENEKTPHARADRIGQAHRRTRSAGGQPDDAQPARHCLGGVLEQAALSGRTSAQAQGDVPHQDFSRAPMRLLLDGTLDHRYRLSERCWHFQV